MPAMKKPAAGACTTRRTAPHGGVFNATGTASFIAAPSAASPALEPYVADEYMPGKEVQGDDELLDFARQTGSTIFHPTGTCKMGSDRDAVVDDRLRVHGVASLRVVDCSIMPTLVSASTNATAIMIAEKAADMILEDAAA